MMKILFVNNYLSYPLDSGGSIATDTYLNSLGNVSELHLLLLLKNMVAQCAIDEAIQYYKNFCKTVEIHLIEDINRPKSRKEKLYRYFLGDPIRGDWSETAADIIRKNIRKNKIDLLWAGRTHVGKYLRIARELNIFKILTTHNVESKLVYQRILSSNIKYHIKSWIVWWDIKRLEKKVTKLADLITTISKEDHKYYRKMRGPKSVLYLPFAIKENLIKESEKDLTEEIENRICFIGNLSWFPNIDAAKYLIKTIMPLVWQKSKNIICYIVGKDPPKDLVKMNSEKIKITGAVPSVVPYIKQAAIIVLPLRMGSGIKIKLLESMALEKPVITTTIGAHGIPIENGKHAIVADTPKKIADSIIKLLGDKSLRKELSKSGKQLALENFSEQSLRKSIGEILNLVHNEKSKRYYSHV